MTDSEIIKALECCKQNCLSKCSDCPAGKVYEFCSQKIINDALDLINRLKSKKEALRMDKEQLESDVINANMNCEHLLSEIERLTTLAKLGNMRADDYRAMRDKCKTARAEAIKEFAERLKDYLRQQPQWNVIRENYKNVGFSYDDVFFGIEKVVKKMTESE